MGDPEILTVLTAISALIAAVSAVTAIVQTRLQRKVHQDAAQPYVWVDIRPDSKEHGLLTVDVGNSGQTFATNVRAAFDPPLPRGTLAGKDEAASKRLREGLPSLAPGKQLSWALGMGHVVLGTDESRRYTVTIDADGPFGPLPRLRFDIDVISYKEVLIRPDGSSRQIGAALDEIATALKSAKKA